MHRFVCTLALIVGPFLAQASTVASALSGAELRGMATFRFVGFPLYEARLFTENGTPLDWNKDFALELKYLRNLTELDLVEGTMREIARTGALLPVRAQLEECYENVRKGDRYTAVSDGQNKIIFWLNGEQTCTLAYPEIKLRFMEIFLGENSRSKSFTRKLKGL